MGSWYVIKSKPKQEKRVFRCLSTAGYKVFLPEIQGLSCRKPLFPSYLFILAELKQASEYQLVRFTRGVSHVLGDGRTPYPMDSTLIDELMSRTRDGRLIEQNLLFHEGDTVRVTRGILKDLVGMIERHMPDEKRVEILFKWWSTSLRAKLKYTDLERAA